MNKPGADQGEDHYPKISFDSLLSGDLDEAALQVNSVCDRNLVVEYKNDIKKVMKALLRKVGNKPFKK